MRTKIRIKIFKNSPYLRRLVPLKEMTIAPCACDSVLTTLRHCVVVSRAVLTNRQASVRTDPGRPSVGGVGGWGGSFLLRA